MALEPRGGSAVEEESSELLDMRRRLWFALAFTAPLLALAMSEYLPVVERLVPGRARVLLELALATPVCVWAGWPFYVASGSVGEEQEPQHVHARSGSGVFVAYDVQRRRGSLARACSLPRSATRMVESAVYFEAAGVIVTPDPARAGARAARRGARPAAPSEKLLGLAPGRRAACDPDGRRRGRAARRRRWSATACGCVRARRSRSMAWCSKGRAPSTNRWSRGANPRREACW